MAEWPTTSTSVTSAEIVDGSIVDADVSASAAIQASKLSGVETPAGAQTKADAAQAAAEATAATDATAKADAAEAAAVATAATDATMKANAAQTAAEATAAAALTAHEADTTSVHGITDTTALETTTGAQAKADAAQTAAEATADGALSTHTADTTSVHGITDTSTLIVEGDARLTDERTPTDGSVTAAKLASGQNLTLLGATFTGTVPGSLNAVKFSMSGASATSASTGGVVNITTTGHTGAGLVVYSNRGNDAGGRLVSIWADNAAFNQSAFYCRYDGVANAAVIDNQGSGTSNVALTVTSTNASDTTLGISGTQTTRAVLKITHTGGAGTSGAAITIQKDGVDTAAQGIFGDTEDASATGKWINLRLGGTEVFVVTADGNVDAAGTITSGGTDVVLDDDSRLIPTATTARPAFAPVQVIEPLDTGWSDTYSQGTITHDTTVKLYGGGSLKMTGPTGTNLFGAKKDLAAAEDWSRSAFSLWMRSDDWASLTDYSVAVSTGGTGFTNFWNAELRPDVTPVRENDEWSQVVFTRDDFAVGSGSPDWTDVQSVILRAYSADGETPTIWFDQFERYPVQEKGIVSIIFDDGYDDTYSTAKPILDEYGMRAGIAIVPGIVGDAGYVTQAQVDSLAQAGWDINGHGASNLTSLSSAAALADVQATKTYLMNGGYKGADVYVYPNGGWNDTVKGIVGRYFTLARGTDQFLQTATYYPPLNLNGRQVGASISTGTVTGEIDDAAANGTWLILVFHNIEASGATGVGYNEADFQTIIDHLATADVDVLTVSEVGNWAPVAERPIDTHTFTVSGEASVASGAARLYIEDGGRIISVRASVGTAPTGASLIVDVNRNGTTIYGTQGNRPTITASSNTAIGGAASNAVLDPGDYLTVDIDQVGSTVAGSDLTVQVRVRRR